MVMTDFTFNDLLMHFEAVENMRNSGCILTDMEEPTIRKFIGQSLRIDGFGLIICTKGECQLSIGKKEYRIEMGELLLATPMSRAIVHQCNNFSARGLFLHEGFQLIQNILPMLCSTSLLVHIMQNPVYKIEPEQFDQALSMMESIRWIITRKADSQLNHEAIRNGITMFLCVMGDCLQSSVLSQKIRIRTQDRSGECFFRFINLLAHHHKIGRGVNFYADQLCLTPKYLTTLVRTASGKSAKTWIDDFIISDAMFLLKHSDKSIQQIADALNFPNQSFFGKFFKEHTGCSPSNFRSDSCNLEENKQ